MTELEQLIYTQLLELYTFDLEIELLVEKMSNAKRVAPQIPPSPAYPWDQPPKPQWPTQPTWYGPYYVTKTTDHTCQSPE